MSQSITCSIKIFILAIAPFLLILVDFLCEFAMVLCVYILLSPQEEEVHYSHECKTDVHIQQHIHQKDLNLFLTSYGYSKVIDKLEKTQTRNSAVLWSL